MNGRRSAWVLAPLHLAAVATGAKSFRDNPIIGSPTLNRMGLHVGRMLVAQAMADRRRRRLAHLVSGTDAADFARDGFIVKENFLAPDAFAALRGEVIAYQAPARDTIQGDAVTRRFPLDRERLADLPHLRDLLKDPRWLGALRYVGASSLAPLNYIQTIFSHVQAGPADPQTELHSDTFHTSVKAWLSLNDVSEDDGPLTYVPGSHRLTKRRLAWERSASVNGRDNPVYPAARGSPRIELETLARLGLPQPRIFAVPANTLIVADTLGFHARGESAKPTARLEIWAYGRRNPFLPWTGFDPLAAPLVNTRQIALMWSALDLAERAGVKRNVWRPTGLVGPLDPPNLGIFS